MTAFIICSRIFGSSLIQNFDGNGKEKEIVRGEGISNDQVDANIYKWLDER
ncbi:MAG TPA: hypothetical protein VF346_05945 [Bacteroidales bacterium]